MTTTNDDNRRPYPNVHTSRIISVLGAVLAVVACLGVSLMWAAHTPSKPKDMPATSVWVPGPNAPLDFPPRGVWIGCWLEKTRNVNRCKVADYKGQVEFEEDFVSVTASGSIPDAELKLKQIGTMELWTWVEEHKREVPVIRLQNGTVLVPKRDVDALRIRYTH